VDKNVPPHNLISPKIHQAKKLRELSELRVIFKKSTDSFLFSVGK
jgi:hypothetical protein